MKRKEAAKQVKGTVKIQTPLKRCFIQPLASW